MHQGRMQWGWSAAFVVVALIGAGVQGEEPGKAGGSLPTDAKGAPLNFDFEAGTLKDWTAEGDAFAGAVVDGDMVSARRSDMKSRHAGRFWVGGYEGRGDGPRGTLTSVPFVVTKPYASFLVGGGSFPDTAVELIRKEDGKLVRRVSGRDDRGYEAGRRRRPDAGPRERGVHPARRQQVRRLGPPQLRRLPAPRRQARDPRRPRPDAPRRVRSRRPSAGRSRRGGDDRARPASRSRCSRASLDVHQPDRLRYRRTWPALGRRSVFVPRSAGPPPEARDQIVIFEDTDNGRPFRSRRRCSPNQAGTSSAASRARLRRRLAKGAARPSFSSSPTRTATTAPTARPGSCSTAGASRTRTRS